MSPSRTSCLHWIQSSHDDRNLKNAAIERQTCLRHAGRNTLQRCRSSMLTARRRKLHGESIDPSLRFPLDKADQESSGPCIRGHRSSKCQHSDRVLIEVRKPGRPLSACPHPAGSCGCQRAVFYTVPKSAYTGMKDTE